MKRASSTEIVPYSSEFIVSGYALVTKNVMNKFEVFTKLPTSSGIYAKTIDDAYCQHRIGIVSKPSIYIIHRRPKLAFVKHVFKRAH